GRELGDEVRAGIAAEGRRDEEQRIRQELQIQVRRQLLSELTPNLGASGLTSRDTQGGPPARMPYMGDRTPKPMRITSEQSPEALEVFREEAQEHLLAITTGIAELETNPNDMTVLQSIRRAMHTLKGAAGMMGFGAIQQIAHTSEDLLDRLVANTLKLSPNLVSLLLDTSDILDQLVRGFIGSPEEERQLQLALGARYAQVTGVPVEASTELRTDDAARGESVSVTMEATEDVDEARARGDDHTDLSVRLQLSKLDDLVNL